MVDKQNGPRICQCCDAVLVRKRYGRRLEDRRVFERRKFCSTACSNAKSAAAKKKRRESIKNQQETQSDISTAELKTAYEILEEAMNNEKLDWITRISAAKALLPYQGRRAAGAVGKKEERADAAKSVTTADKFTPGRAPKIFPFTKQGS